MVTFHLDRGREAPWLPSIQIEVEKPLGGRGGLYLWVVVAGCACVWLWVCYSSVLMFVYGGGFLFCIFFLKLMVFFNIFIYIILMYRIEK